MRMRQIVLAMSLVISAVISLPVHADGQSGSPADCKPIALAQLPMTLKSGHVTIPASVNGKDATLGIDTGGPFSSLTLAAAHRKGESDFDVVRAHGNVKFRRAESAVRHPTTWPSVVLRRLRTAYRTRIVCFRKNRRLNIKRLLSRSSSD